MTSVYIGGRGNPEAKIMVVGEAIGPVEVQRRFCFAGASWDRLVELCAAKGVQLNPSELYLTNVLREKPPEDHKGRLDISSHFTYKKKVAEKHGLIWMDNAYVSVTLLAHMDHLAAEIKAVRPNLIIAMGNLALWALTRETGIDTWRGSEMWSKSHNVKVIPMQHVARLRFEPDLRHIMRADMRRIAREAQSEALHKRNTTFTLRPSLQVTADFFDFVRRQLDAGPFKLSADIETRRGQVACIGFAWSVTDAICIPIQAVGQAHGYWTVEEEIQVVTWLQELFAHPNLILVGHNWQYDEQYCIKNYGLYINMTRDTMISWHTMFTRDDRSLAYICSLLCEHYTYWKDLGKEWDYGIPEEQYWDYNCRDCVNTYEADEALQEAIAQANFENQVQFEQDLHAPVMKMMLRGVKQDVVLKAQLSKELGEEIQKRVKWLEDVLGHPFNPNSNGAGGQMQHLFYDDFKLPKVVDRDGHPTLNEAALLTLAGKEPLIRPLVEVITQTRSLKVFKSTFADAEIDPDGRIRCTYWIPGTATLRFASKENAFGTGTNLQNLPKGNTTRIVEALRGSPNFQLDVGQLAERLSVQPLELEEELEILQADGIISIAGRTIMLDFYQPNIRKIFIPDEGYTLIASDLERAELTVSLWATGDRVIRDLMRSRQDVHGTLAKEIHFSRDNTKRLIYGVQNGGQAAGIGRGLNPPRPAGEVQNAINRYFQICPGVRIFQEEIGKQVKDRGWVENAFGFRCYPFSTEDKAVRDMFAWVASSTVSIVINTGLKAIDKHVPEHELLMQTHDEIVGQVPTHLFNDDYIKKLDSHMLVEIPFDEPLTVPVEHKVSTKSLGDAKKYKPTT